MVTLNSEFGKKISTKRVSSLKSKSYFQTPDSAQFFEYLELYGIFTWTAMNATWGIWKVLPSGPRWSMPSLGPAPDWTRRSPAARVPGSSRSGFGRKCLATPGGGSAVGSPEARSYESPGVNTQARLESEQRSDRAVWSSSHTGCANWGKTSDL